MRTREVMRIVILSLAISIMALFTISILMAIKLKSLNRRLKSLRTIVEKHQQSLEIANRMFKADEDRFKAIENLIQIQLSQSELTGQL